MSAVKHVFAPESVDGQILSITPFRGMILVACEHAVYQLTPQEGVIEWTIARISTRRPRELDLLEFS